VVWYRLTSSANTVDMISAVFPFSPSYPIKRGLRKAHWPHSLEPNTSAHEALIGFYQELAMHNGHVGMANPITSQSRDPTPLTHQKKRATEFYLSDSTTPDTSALNPHYPARTFGSDVSTFRPTELRVRSESSDRIEFIRCGRQLNSRFFSWRRETTNLPRDFFLEKRYDLSCQFLRSEVRISCVQKLVRKRIGKTWNRGGRGCRQQLLPAVADKTTGKGR
jgi:hypothetical protein